MPEYVTIAAEQRVRPGKGTARAARRRGRIPAVVYGNNQEALLITVEQRTLEQELHRAGFFTRLMDLNLDGATHRVLPRDMQLHPVSDVPLHVDFLRYSADRKIAVEVAVSFENEAECPGLKVGGVLNIVRHAVEVLCTAERIPTAFTVDLSGLDIGASIHASSLALPEGVEFTITDRDFTIATVAAPTVMAAEEEEAVEGEEALEEMEAVAEGEGEAAAGAEEKDRGGE